MNAITGFVRINLPENGNNSGPSPPAKLYNQKREIEPPKQELKKITRTFSLNSDRELSIKEKLDLMVLQNEERRVRAHERAHERDGPCPAEA